MNFLSQVNFLAVLVAAVSYFGLATVWFSSAFGKVWQKELRRKGFMIESPKRTEMVWLMIRSFIFNLVIAFAIAFLVHALHCHTLIGAIKLSIVIGIGISCANLGMTYSWVGHSLRLFLVDAISSFAGILICTVILALWR